MFDKVLGMPYCVKYAGMQVFFPYKEGIYQDEKTRVLAYIVQCLCIWTFKVKKLNSLLSVWNSYQDLLVICSQYKKIISCLMINGFPFDTPPLKKLRVNSI